ncbi:MAG TPA: hypothetical protein VFC53_11840 [Dehalococcoidia bacterium]|nr:hypothetical protein [Dehalococcoidia bacterium]
MIGRRPIRIVGRSRERVAPEAGAAKPPLLRACIALVAAGGAVVGAAAIAGGAPDDWRVFAVLVCAAFGAELFAVSLFIDSHVSVSAAALMASGAVFGVGGTTACAAAVTVAGAARGDRDAAKALFNFGALALAGAAFVGVFDALDGSVASASVGRALVPGLIAGLANMAVNSALVAIAVGIDRSRAVRTVWMSNYLWLVPQYAVIAVAGLAVALAVSHFGAWSIALFALPAVSVSEALHTRAEAMRRVRQRAFEVAAAHRRAG